MTKSASTKSETNFEFERARLDFEREKWQAEHALRREEINLKSEELNRSRWVNPLVIAVFAAAVAALGNAGVTLISSYRQSELERERAALTQKVNLEESRSTLKLEQTKSEAARILEVVKTNDPDKAAANLKFLIEVGLIVDARDQIQAYLDKRQPGQGVSLPTSVVDISRPLIPDVIQGLMEKPAREFIAAGRANEQVPAHSPIPELFLAALNGAADTYKHGVISTVDIHVYLLDRVLQIPDIHMTPQMGGLPNPTFSEGTFLFRINPASTTERRGLGVPTSDDPLRHGHALLVGNAHYIAWPQLDDVPLQLDELEKGLKNHFDTVDAVKDLETEQLRQKINGFLRTYGNDRNARLFIYYAGQGYSEIIPERNEIRGYITGIDTPAIDGTKQAYDTARPKAISMAEIRGPLEDVPAKSILMVFDSAFAGTIFSMR